MTMAVWIRSSLSSKALLLEVPKRPGGKAYRVITPQAIAAVRGTKWAVDAVENKTSVFVVKGRVAVGRRTGRHSVFLGPGEGVDVEAAGPFDREALASRPRVCLDGATRPVNSE